MTDVLDRDLLLLARTFVRRVEDIKNEFADRDQVLDVVALATLCQEHALLIGPPGTAKTGLLQRYAAMLDTHCFQYLLTKFTEPAELFGPVDVKKFQEDGVYQVKTAGMLPESKLAFLDEIFQGSSAILNSLLTIVNERVFHNGADFIRTDLLSIFGASNEMPDDPVLEAFCDRFLFRCRLDYVPEDAIEHMLALGWRGEQAAASAATGRFPLEQLRTLQRAILGIDLDPVREPLTKLLYAFREEGIDFSDRRAVKSQKAIAASALLGGRARASVEDLAPIVHMWGSPQDEVSIRRIIESQGIPLDRTAADVRDLPEITYDLRHLRLQLEQVRSVEEHREVMRRLGALRHETQTHYPHAAMELAEIGRTQREVMERLREQVTGEDVWNV
ncbi:AAA family ATPase [Actinoplanes oblitus]|uniref:AAA family ATPase n=1 Tax=Actinoplanes oblitus TaxID=3040509 RepID=A0ABY8WNH1_9ACTN|nr:AAA family ATPase [Actinoplanes oblitus]WIM99414.1 AAA family ATPase [Actinoplanes oblitus]